MRLAKERRIPIQKGKERAYKKKKFKMWLVVSQINLQV